MDKIDSRVTLELGMHPNIEMTDLLAVENPMPVCEGEFRDADGTPYWLYTVAGFKDGQPIHGMDHQRKCIIGATIGGDVAIVTGKNRKEADWLAGKGLAESIDHMRTLALSGELDPGRNSGIITDTRAGPKPS